MSRIKATAPVVRLNEEPCATAIDEATAEIGVGVCELEGWDVEVDVESIVSGDDVVSVCSEG
jgi:hypothetical protein